MGHFVWNTKKELKCKRQVSWKQVKYGIKIHKPHKHVKAMKAAVTTVVVEVYQEDRQKLLLLKATIIYLIVYLLRTL